MKLREIYILFFLLILASTAVGQQINPFEIRERMSSGSAPGDTLSIKSIKNDISDLPIEPESVDPPDTVGRQGNINPFDVQSPKKQTQKESTIRSGKEEVKSGIHPTKDDGKNKPLSGNFLFWVILSAFLLFAVILSIDRWYITKLFKSILNYNMANSIMRENTGSNLVKMILLYGLFLIIGTAYIYLIIRFFTGGDSFSNFILSMTIIFGTYFVRHSAMRLVNLIFPRIPELKQYSFTIVSFNIVLGIFLLIPTLVAAYGPDWIARFSIYLGLIFIVVFYILRSFRGLLISFNYLVSIPFHFFLYLCAFEIIPLLVMYKLIADFG